MPADTTLQTAQEFIGNDVQYDRLDQIFDLQRLIGPVIAYKILLEIAINAEDLKERRLAASQLLTSASESPEKLAERLRASIFSSLSLEQLQAVIQTGITDPEKAVLKIHKLKESA